MTPETQDEADLRRLNAIKVLLAVHENLRGIMLGVCNATDEQIEVQTQRGLDAFKQLDIIERLEFLENSILRMTALFAQFARDSGLAVTLRSARESPTEPDAAQPLEPAAHSTHSVHPGG